MNGYYRYPPRVMQSMGCFTIVLALFFLCLMPLLLVDVMRSALEKLHLEPRVALLAVIGIFVGSLFNIPLRRIEREEEQLVEPMFGFWGITPYFRRVRRDSIIAINVGGGLIPIVLAAWEVFHVSRIGGWPVPAMTLAVIANVFVCYRVARPVQGVGIAMPGFMSPLVAVTATWLLLTGDDYDAVRAPVAFVAGVLGPVIGADLLHLRDITRISAGMLSIGGAGTFDGIVLSGVLAVLLA